MKLKINIKRIRHQIRYSLYQKYKNQKIKTLHSLTPKYSLAWPSIVIPLDKILFNNSLIQKWIYSSSKEIEIGLFSNSDLSLYKVCVYPNFYWYQIFITGINLYFRLYIFRAVVKYLSNYLKNSIKFKTFLKQFKLNLTYSLTRFCSYLRGNLLNQWKKFDEKFFNKIQQNITLSIEKLTDEAVYLKLNSFENFITKFTQRFFLASTFYFLPYVFILGQLLSPGAEYMPTIRWDFNLIKILSFLPKFSEWALPIMYSGLPIAYSPNLQGYLILGYFLIVQKNLHKLKMNLKYQLNVALAITFMMLSYAIHMIKYLLYSFIIRYYDVSTVCFPNIPVIAYENFWRYVEWTLPLYLTQSLLTLILIGLIYNFIIFVIKGYNPDIPIITVSAKKQMTYINPN